MTAATQPVVPATAPVEKSRPFKQRALLWTFGFLVTLIVLFFTYQWAGTSHYRGTVQRVYEQSNDYRAEIVDLEGNVHVVGNQEIKFPYFKLNTADLHAELNRLSKTRDIVDVKVWGFRMSWFSTFPNLIETEFVMSRQDRDQKRAERIADAVLRSLLDKGLIKGGDGIKPAVVQAVKESLDPGPD